MWNLSITQRKHTFVEQGFMVKEFCDDSMKEYFVLVTSSQTGSSLVLWLPSISTWPDCRKIRNSPLRMFIIQKCMAIYVVNYYNYHQRLYQRKWLPCATADLVEVEQRFMANVVEVEQPYTWSSLRRHRIAGHRVEISLPSEVFETSATAQRTCSSAYPMPKNWKMKIQYSILDKIWSIHQAKNATFIVQRSFS